MSMQPSVQNRWACQLAVAVGLALGCGATVQADPLSDAAPDTTEGHDLFVNEWTPREGGPGKPNGLGPHFNETSCVGCHNLGGKGGAGPANKNVVFLFQPRMGARMLHHFGASPRHQDWNEITGKFTAPGSYEKAVQFTLPKVGQRRPVVQRNTPALFGAGLIDSIPDEVVIAAAEESKPMILWHIHERHDGSIRFEAGPKVQGRVSYLPTERPGPVPQRGVGRFGWKAQTITLEEFTLNACAVELGLHVPGRLHFPNLAPNEKPPAFDMSSAECKALVAYVRHLPRPKQRAPIDRESYQKVIRGEELFHAIGCADCHRATLGNVHGIYSDLLLHHMGHSLAEQGGYGGSGSSAEPDEWRTPPLWGCRDSAPYLHDGRAETLQKAIVLHDGEAAPSSWKFLELSDGDQQAVLTFLKSLAAP